MDMMFYPIRGLDAPNDRDKDDIQLTFYRPFRDENEIPGIDFHLWTKALSTVKRDPNSYLHIGSNIPLFEWMIRYTLNHRESSASLCGDIPESDRQWISPLVIHYDNMNQMLTSGRTWRIIYVPSNYHSLVSRLYSILEENGLLILDSEGALMDKGMMHIAMASLLSSHKNKIVLLSVGRQLFLYKI